MAKKAALASLFFVQGFDISGDVGALNKISAARPVLDVTPINKSAVERVMGLADGSISFNSFFNDAAGQQHLALKAVPTTNIIATFCQAQSVGSEAACLLGKQNNYDHDRGSDGSIVATIDIEASGFALEWCQLLTAGIQTDSTASSGSSKDDSASSSNGLRAYLQVVDIDSGTPTVVIEDSPNDSTWSTLVSFTAVVNGTEPTAERVIVTGTVNRYLRITTTGTFSNCDFVVAYQRGSSKDIEDLS